METTVCAGTVDTYKNSTRIILPNLKLHIDVQSQRPKERKEMFLISCCVWFFQIKGKNTAVDCSEEDNC
jgi:hypothetical protein